MEFKIENLTAEKAKDGLIYVYFSDGRISEYRMLIARIEGDLVRWQGEDGTIRSAIA